MALDLYSMSPDPSPRTIIRMGTVRQRTGLSRSMVYSLIESGEFPRQVSLGARAVGWYEDGVQAWIENRDARKANSSKVAQRKRWTESGASVKQPTSVGIGPAGRTRVSPSPDSDRQNVPAPSTSKRNEVEPAPDTLNRGRREKQQILDAGKPQPHARSVNASEFKRLCEENRRLKELLMDLILNNPDLESALRNYSTA